jgi:hypothetical protein
MLTGAMIVIGAITYLAAVMLFAGDRAAMMVQAGLSLRRHRNVPS